MIQYQNTGAPFMRDDGKSRWLKGEIHTPTDNELKRRRYKLRPAPGEVETPTTAQVAPTPEGVDGKWTLTMTPEKYLELQPDGGHADLARKIIAARKKEKKSKWLKREKSQEEPADGDSD